MMLNIASEPMATPIANLRRAKKVRSTNGGLTRASTTSSRANAAAASANGPMTESACRANTSDTISVVSRTKPSQSARRLSPLDAWAAAGRAQARPAIALSMSTTLNQKITRQPVKCVNAPPRSGPMLKPSMRKPVHAPIAAALRSEVALVSTAASVLGTAIAAARPCKARPASSSACVPAAAMMQDATANSANPAIDAGRAPNRSAAWPPSTMKAAETTR
jgi:hypothetical protein